MRQNRNSNLRSYIIKITDNTYRILIREVKGKNYKMEKQKETIIPLKPGEHVLKMSRAKYFLKGSILKGELCLTSKRLFFAIQQGFLVKETDMLFSINLGEIALVKSEGLINKFLKVWHGVGNPRVEEFKVRNVREWVNAIHAQL